MLGIAMRSCALFLTVSVIVSLIHSGGEKDANFSLLQSSKSRSLFDPQDTLLQTSKDRLLDGAQNSSLEFDFYRDKCPRAEQIIRWKMNEIFALRPDVAPALLRLLFHDCFIQGCDGSVLLDGMHSERTTIPNRSLRGFDEIEAIKSELEEECPGVVSCSDILALAAREGVVLASGPFYPLLTGRRDSLESYGALATSDLPSPINDVSETLAAFSRRGFDARETVCLLGGHNIGTVHCHFFVDRLSDFQGTGAPDPTLERGFLNFLRGRCNKSSGSEAGMGMDEESPHSAFDAHYYRNLLLGRGIMYADQQLMANATTAAWVAAYASDDGSLFRRDFARAMFKLSALGVLSGNQGEVRRRCSAVGDA